MTNFSTADYAESADRWCEKATSIYLNRQCHAWLFEIANRFCFAMHVSNPDPSVGGITQISDLGFAIQDA